MDLQQVVTDNMEWLRRHFNMTISELAGHLHITQPTYSQKKSGKVRWNIDDLSYAAAAFGVPVAYIVTDNMQRPEDYQLRTLSAVDNQPRELAGSAPGPRFIALPEDKDGENKKRGGSARPRTIIAPAPWMVPPVGLEPTLRRF